MTIISTDDIPKHVIGTLFILYIALFSIPSKIHVVNTAEASVIAPKLATDELLRICACESTGNPTNEPKHRNYDGSVLRGYEVESDIGMCQINIDPEITDWLKISQENNWDVFTKEGNINMANWIYKKYGNQPWSASKECWEL